ncbi:hypothetical protein [Nitrosopumilus sp.]|uniref:hypothetical protein n=1 Tax=Nitrosopumilus sp. TaxID=2024843 RepID=UPI0029319C80|nr:hypothetical protein [Nitrosopumilus sp.]
MKGQFKRRKYQQKITRWAMIGRNVNDKKNFATFFLHDDIPCKYDSVMEEEISKVFGQLTRGSKNFLLNYIPIHVMLPVRCEPERISNPTVMCRYRALNATVQYSQILLVYDGNKIEGQ